jgi:hypothetical protein
VVGIPNLVKVVEEVFVGGKFVTEIFVIMPK